MKKLYIFDMGGVVVRNHDVLPAIAQHLGISTEDGRLRDRDLWIAIMEGRIITAEFWNRFSRRSGIVVNEELFGKYFQPVRNEPIYDLIQELKHQHRVVCGTNSIAEHYAFHMARGDYQVFDAVYASHKIGLAKPRPEFYHYILAQENVLPEHTIFIDDLPENIIAAQQIGIIAIHFTDYEHLLTQLGMHLF